MTRVLAFDTASETVAIGIGELDGSAMRLVGSYDSQAPRQANRVLLQRVADALQAAGGIRPDAVVVGQGPGSFTGVRIGVAAAKGYAHGLGVPLFGVGTLDAIAWRFTRHCGLVGVVGDAMRGEVYPALFRVAAGRVERLSPDCVANPTEAAEAWAAAVDEPLLLAGNGLTKHLAAFQTVLGSRIRVAADELWHPSGAGLIAAYAAARAAGTAGSGDAGELLPIYTRLSDAEENERVRAGLLDAGTPASGVAGTSDGQPGGSALAGNGEGPGPEGAGS